MENEAAEINKAYDQIVAHLTKLRDAYIADLSNAELARGYEGITEDDAYLWFIESF